jgi:hypothetical protein
MVGPRHGPEGRTKLAGLIPKTSDKEANAENHLERIVTNEETVILLVRIVLSEQGDSDAVAGLLGNNGRTRRRVSALTPKVS